MVNAIFHDHLRTIDIPRAAHKLKKFGSVLILPEDYLKFWRHLESKGIAHTDDYVEELDAYVFTKKEEERI